MRLKPETLARLRMSRLRSLALFLILTPLLFGMETSASARVRRIKFKPGATTASVRGRLKGMNDSAVFVLRARKGQHMRLEIIAKGPTRGMLTSPNGDENGSPGGVFFDDQLTQTGDYKIRVTESQMAEAWKGKFTLKVTITG